MNIFEGPLNILLTPNKFFSQLQETISKSYESIYEPLDCDSSCEKKKKSFFL